MTTPISIIAEAIHDAECGCGQMEAAALNTASVAAGALVDDRVVANAVRALRDAGLGQAQPSHLGINDNALTEFARVVLRSVGA